MVIHDPPGGRLIVPYCPFCRSAYDDGTTHCPDCAVRLVDELSPLEAPDAEPVKEVAVARFRSQLEAEMWAEVLEAKGIPTVLVPLGPGAAAFGISLWVPYELRVRDTDLDRARRLLPEAET
jgi:uncharacterized Zn finger protein (UPF0148 family)